MTNPSFLRLLRFLRFMALVFVVAGAGLALALLGRTADAVSNPEVRLSLQTNRPAVFTFWYAMQDSWQNGDKTSAYPLTGWDHLAPMHLTASQRFELVASPITPLLRYQEPNALKRVALLYLGALPGYLSLPGVLFWVYGSWLLLRLLQDVTPETPFTQANARRLAHLTLLVLGLHLWDYVAQVSVLYLVPAFRVVRVATALNRYVQLSPEDLIPGLQVGFMLVVIAAVYRRGVELSQEATLVI